MTAIEDATGRLREQLAALEKLAENDERIGRLFVPLDDVVKAHVAAVLLHADSITSAAKMLKVSRRQLHRWINDWGIETHRA